jgi:hypothetical protein
MVDKTGDDWLVKYSKGAGKVEGAVVAHSARRRTRFCNDASGGGEASMREQQQVDLSLRVIPLCGLDQDLLVVHDVFGLEHKPPH